MGQRWRRYGPLLLIPLAILIMLLAIYLVMSGEGLSEYGYETGP